MSTPLAVQDTPGDTSLSLVSSARPVKKLWDGVFRVVLYGALGVALAALVALLWRTWLEGRGALDLDLIRKQPSERPARAGIESGVFGTILVTGLCAAIAIPIGIATAVYLEEFAHKTRWYNRLLDVNIQNLAAVPSIVYGILGLAFIARGPLGWGPTVQTAGVVLALLVLPTVIIASREAIRAVPSSLRGGSLALGATQWQTVRKQVLPSAIPGIATGAILAVSRAIGETAPLLLLGGLTFITTNPTWVDDRYTTVPLLIYNYSVSPRAELREIAAASIIMLMVLILLLNGLAIAVRNKYQRRW